MVSFWINIVVPSDNFVDDGDTYPRGYPSSWWSVVSCEAHVEEIDYPPDWIEEFVEYRWIPEVYYYSAIQILTFALIATVFFFVVYVCICASECIICGRKNAFINKQGNLLL